MDQSINLKDTSNFSLTPDLIASLHQDSSCLFGHDPFERDKRNLGLAIGEMIVRNDLQGIRNIAGHGVPLGKIFIETDSQVTERNHLAEFSIKNGSPEMIDVLSKSGVDYSETRTTLLAVARAEDDKGLDVLKAVVEAGGGLSTTALSDPEDGYATVHITSPLLSAAHNAKALEYLMARQADVNAEDSYGRTPYEIVTRKRDLAAMDRLATAKANVNTVSFEFDGMPSYPAKEGGQIDSSESETRASYRVEAFKLTNSPYVSALLSQEEELIATVKRHGADPNANDSVAGFVLAVRGAPRDIERYVVDGGRLDVRDDASSGMTPILLAAANGNSENVETLGKLKADINARCYNGNGLGHCSVWSGKPETILAAARVGADFTAVNDLDRTPLDDASRSKNANILVPAVRQAIALQKALARSTSDAAPKPAASTRVRSYGMSPDI